MINMSLLKRTLCIIHICNETMGQKGVLPAVAQGREGSVGLIHETEV